MVSSDSLTQVLAEPRDAAQPTRPAGPAYIHGIASVDHRARTSKYALPMRAGVFRVQATPMMASGRMTTWRGAESTGASTYSSLTFPPTVLYLTYLFSRVYRDVIFIACACQVRDGGE